METIWEEVERKNSPEVSGNGTAFQPRGSQVYIGVPNGIVLCADEGDGKELSGRFYHAYSTEPVFFKNEDQFIFKMEDFFDSINFPYPATNIRSFTDKTQTARCMERKERVVRDEELLARHGDMGSFIIRVHQRQNSSMQGRLTWIEKNKTVHFRSIWEMIRLIDSAMEMSLPESEEDIPSWTD